MTLLQVAAAGDIDMCLMLKITCHLKSFTQLAEIFQMALKHMRRTKRTAFNFDAILTAIRAAIPLILMRHSINR
jgi:hypothetical protein